MMHRDTWVFALVCALAFASRAHAVGTPAGTTITNQAEMTFQLGGATQQLASNEAVLAVAEIVDVNLLVQTPERLVASGDTAQPLFLTLTNTGNGSETFELLVAAAVPGDEFDPLPGNPAIFFDTDGSGDFSAGDAAYAPGSNDPSLLSDESVDLFLVSDIPAGLADGDRGLVELRARALTAPGAPGVSIAGAGANGVDAVIGASGGEALALAHYLIGQVSMLLTKSATISDPDGGSLAVSGATIAYAVLVSAAGTGSATDAVFADPIPANTTYLPGSLRLNGLPITDTADSDPGAYLLPSAEVSVNLGTIGAGGTAQRIEFSVIIN